ncbi:tetratricopeptide repeat protein [Chryseolinea lacunae]|uniref:Tetratricopeptide repeat protein n=1 Tax=Chryseolinea lacunae TaxID=2801331 RepID=A0ABS1KR35_9BACT|nr:tetratricopeptide repeat protein [Chryseolinea lacunae]MBL0740751.1 tetratricopeptide repeat protein [Chryseolinea lacunae]
MKNKTVYVLSLAFPALLLLSCSEKREQDITHRADYAPYLAPRADASLQQCNEEITFWKNKQQRTPDSETCRLRLAGLLSSRFMLTGDIEDVFVSDSLYQSVLASSGNENASVHRALAANAITQHQFGEAYQQIQKALAIGEGKAASLFMLVDVNLELGDYDGAQRALNKIATRNLFPYIVRKAKIKDHEGDLDSAIVLMETALVKAKDNASLLLWTQSNLADMYGHAGRVEEAYRLNLAILETNPDYDYALKGIAWIAFSHDHRYAEARSIALYINSKRATPDMHLLLAKIADAENNMEEKMKELRVFYSLATSPRYGDMYNKYLALVEVEEFSNPAKTIALAQREIHNRPTPQSYDLLAWGYYHDGKFAEALQVAEDFLVDKTFEPDVLYHLGMIYEANGQHGKGSDYLNRAKESSFELGPVVAKKIEKALKSS